MSECRDPATGRDSRAASTVSPCAPERGGHDHAVSFADLRRREDVREHASSHAGRGDEDAAALARGHHLRVTGDDARVGLPCRRGGGFEDPAQVGDRKAFLQDESQGDADRLCPADGKVVAGAEHREPADVAAGEERGIDHVAVRGHEEIRPDLHGARVGELGVGLAAEDRVDDRLDEVARERAAAPVLEPDELRLSFIFRLRSGNRRRTFLRRTPCRVPRDRPACTACRRGRTGAARPCPRPRASRGIPALRSPRPAGSEKTFSASLSRELGPQPERAAGDHTQPAPRVASRLERALRSAAGQRVSPGPHRPRVGVFHAVSPCPDLAQHHEDPQEHVDGLEPGDDPRAVLPAPSRNPYASAPMITDTWPGRRKPSMPCSGLDRRNRSAGGTVLKAV